jgi:carbonic anhydrase/acetyltransferase-like protein (isoleucine patch superfamily)
MEIKHREMTPSVHPDAYVAPTAVLSGQVSVGAGSCVLHGAVLTADGGPVEWSGITCWPGRTPT